MIDTMYFRQAELLPRVLPLVNRESVFDAEYEKIILMSGI